MLARIRFEACQLKWPELKHFERLQICDVTLVVVVHNTKIHKSCVRTHMSKWNVVHHKLIHWRMITFYFIDKNKECKCCSIKVKLKNEKVNSIKRWNLIWKKNKKHNAPAIPSSRKYEKLLNVRTSNKIRQFLAASVSVARTRAMSTRRISVTLAVTVTRPRSLLVVTVAVTAATVTWARSFAMFATTAASITRARAFAFSRMWAENFIIENCFLKSWVTVSWIGLDLRMCRWMLILRVDQAAKNEVLKNTANKHHGSTWKAQTS